MYYYWKNLGENKAATALSIKCVRMIPNVDGALARPCLKLESAVVVTTASQVCCSVTSVVNPLSSRRFLVLYTHSPLLLSRLLLFGFASVFLDSDIRRHCVAQSSTFAQIGTRSRTSITGPTVAPAE